MINKKMLMRGFTILLFFVIFYQSAMPATATIFPSYNTEQDCRNCHGIVASRHHLLVANGTQKCVDCHAMKFDTQNQTYFPEVIRNCLICHPGKNHAGVHHLMVAQGLFGCTDCHAIEYDNQSQSYYPEVTWDCTKCHSTVLSLNGTTPPVFTQYNTNPLTTVNFSPSSPVNDTIGTSREFVITINQVADIAWYIDGNSVQNNYDVTSSSYNNTSSSQGVWNVSAIAKNANGTLMLSWIWNVTALPPSIPPTIVTSSSITVESPNGGDNWRRGTTHQIKWTSVDNKETYVRIELLKGNTVVNTLATKAQNVGSYSWKIFNSHPATDYKIRITGTRNRLYMDESDNYFEISK